MARSTSASIRLHQCKCKCLTATPNTVLDHLADCYKGGDIVHTLIVVSASSSVPPGHRAVVSRLWEGGAPAQLCTCLWLAMFYDLRITQSIDLEPRYFGTNLRAILREKLTEKVWRQPVCAFSSFAGILPDMSHAGLAVDHRQQCSSSTWPAQAVTRCGREPQRLAYVTQKQESPGMPVLKDCAALAGGGHMQRQARLHCVCQQSG